MTNAVQGNSKAFTARTLVPIGVIVTVGVALLVTATWLDAQHEKTTHVNSWTRGEQEIHQSLATSQNKDVCRRLDRLEVKLDLILERLPRGVK